MRQVETSRTLVFDGDCHARAFFEALLCENMDLGGRRTSSCCSAAASGAAAAPRRRAAVADGDRPVLPHGHRQRVLQDLPGQAVLEGRRGAAHRDRRQFARYLGCRRMLSNLPELQAKARAINDRLLHTETHRQARYLCPVIQRITRPTLTGQGRKAPALRFGDLRVQALTRPRRHAAHVTGITTGAAARYRPAAPPLQHEPGQLRPVRLANASSALPAEPLHPHPRRCCSRSSTPGL